MNIVLDSNVLISDFRLSSTAFRTLVSGAQQLAYTVHVPEVVVDEVCNKYGETLDELLEQLNKIDAKLRRLSGKGTPDTHHTSGAQSRSQYRDWLVDNVQARRWKIAHYPSVRHQTLVAKVLTGRKPFSHGEKGYRDALIWCTVVEVALECDGGVAFITDNHSDFCEPASGQTWQLHAHLCEEVAEQGLPRDRISVYVGLDSFLERCIRPELERLEDVQNQIADGDYLGIDVEREVRDRIDSIVEGIRLQASKLGLPGGGFDAAILTGSVNEVDDFAVQEVSRLNAGAILVSFTITSVCEIEYVTSEDDLRLIPEEEWPRIIRHNRYSVCDYTVREDKEFWISVGATIDTRRAAVDSMDVEAVWFGDVQVL